MAAGNALLIALIENDVSISYDFVGRVVDGDFVRLQSIGADARVDVPELSVVSLSLRPLDGSTSRITIAHPRTVQPGRQTVVVVIPKDVVTGRYGLTLEVTNGTDIVDSKPRRIHIAGISAPVSPSPPSASPTRIPGAIRVPLRNASDARRVALIASGLVVILAVVAAAFLTARRRRRPGSGTSEATTPASQSPST